LDVQNKKQTKASFGVWTSNPTKKTSFIAYEFVALLYPFIHISSKRKHSFPSDILIPKHSQVRERERERDREEGRSCNNNNNGGNHHHHPTTIM